MWAEMECSLTAPPALGSQEVDMSFAQISRNNVGPVESQSAHLVFHLGNFISVDAYLRSAGIQLVHDLSSDDVPAAVWKERIDGVEEGLRNIYRESLTSNERFACITTTTLFI